MSKVPFSGYCRADALRIFANRLGYVVRKVSPLMTESDTIVLLSPIVDVLDDLHDIMKPRRGSLLDTISSASPTVRTEISLLTALASRPSVPVVKDLLKESAAAMFDIFEANQDNRSIKANDDDNHAHDGNDNPHSRTRDNSEEHDIVNDNFSATVSVNELLGAEHLDEDLWVPVPDVGPKVFAGLHASLAAMVAATDDLKRSSERCLLHPLGDGEDNKHAEGLT